MTWIGRLLRRAPTPQPTVRKFADNPITLDQVLALVESRSTKVSRADALTVPSMVRGRNLICSIATLPLAEYAADNSVVKSPLLAQLDPDVANVVTISQTVEDLLFESVAWWRILGFGWDGFPVSVRRLEPGSVSVNPPVGRNPSPLPSGLDPRGAVVYVDGRPVDVREMIRFDSPNPPILVAGARAINRALLLDKAAKTYAESPSPGQILEPADGADPMEDDEIEALVAQLQAAVRRRSAIYVPAALKLNLAPGVSPAELQLVELQKQAGLEIANLIGVDPEDLGISTTSRTYSNNVDRRRDRINDVLAPYMRAVTDRLSMGDVTVRGHVVRFFLDDYLKSNPTERANVQKTYVDMGVIDAAEVRAAEGIAGPPPRKPEPPAPPPVSADTPAEPEATVDASREPAMHFAAEGLTFVDIPLQSFSVDAETRTIEGLAVPYGRVGNKIRFERGALQYGDVKRIKLNVEHDSAQTIGVATAIKDGPNGLSAKFKVARGADGDRVLMLAEDGVLDGLSVEVEFDAARDTVADPRNKTGLLVKRADLRAVALTGSPAFDDARVTRVAASRNEEDTVSDTENPVTEATQEPTPVEVPAQQFTQEQPAEPARAFVDPRRPVAAVAEPAPYRFTRNGQLVAGSHDLAADLYAWHQMHDLAAYQRALGFMRAQFVDDPIAVADVADLNPTINQNRYIDEREFAYPLWSRLGRGAPPNGIQAFSWPKFSASGIVITDHVTGTDPDSEDYQTDTQTVTPGAKDARVQIPREVWDMGGTPGISDLIWRKVVRAWGEKREAVIDAALDAQEVAGMTELATFTAGGGGNAADPFYATLVEEMETALAALHFVRGGFRFEFVATQVDLYGHLAAATDASHRKMYPILAPQNATGTASSRFAAIDVAGVVFVPSTAAAATSGNAASSFLLDPTAVDAWATEPQRIDITHSVSYIDIGVWGYMAAAVNDVAGTRHISYDPVTP